MISERSKQELLIFNIIDILLKKYLKLKNSKYIKFAKLGTSIESSIRCIKGNFVQVLKTRKLKLNH